MSDNAPRRECHFVHGNYECVAVVGEKLKWRTVDPKTGKRPKEHTRGAIVLGWTEDSKCVYVDADNIGFWNPAIQCGDSFRVVLVPDPVPQDDEASR